LTPFQLDNKLGLSLSALVTYALSMCTIFLPELRLTFRPVVAPRRELWVCARSVIDATMASDFQAQFT